MEYEEIREVLKEQSICKGVMQIPRVIVREMPKTIQVKKVVDREKILYIKNAEVHGTGGGTGGGTSHLSAHPSSPCALCLVREPIAELS